MATLKAKISLACTPLEDGEIGPSSALASVATIGAALELVWCKLVFLAESALVDEHMQHCKEIRISKWGDNRILSHYWGNINT